MSSTGRVKFFNDVKGFGFIETEKGDVFMHINDVQGNPPQEGDEVQFDEEFDPRKQKTKASNVTGGTGAPRPPGGWGQYGGKGGFGGEHQYGGKGGFGGEHQYGGKGGFGGYGGAYAGQDSWGQSGGYW